MTSHQDAGRPSCRVLFRFGLKTCRRSALSSAACWDWLQSHGQHVEDASILTVLRL